VDPEIADKIYRPGQDGEVQDVTWSREHGRIDGFGLNQESEIDVEIP